MNVDRAFEELNIIIGDGLHIYTIGYKHVTLYTINNMALAMSRRCATANFQRTISLIKLLCVMSSSLNLTVELQKGSCVCCLHLNHTIVLTTIRLPSGDVFYMKYFIFKYSILH